MLEVMINLKNLFSEEKEKKDTMIDFYLIHKIKNFYLNVTFLLESIP